MPTINTQDLTSLALDWAVAHADGLLDAAHTFGNGATTTAVLVDERGFLIDMRYGCVFAPSTNPAQGQPLLERHRISTQHLGDRIGWGARWPAWVPDGDGETIPAASGPTMLIAGLRCLVAARLGSTVDVPQELAP